MAGLDRAVDELRASTGANRVVLMAHSMGGLVTRGYLDDTAHADKVTRAITLGTPYWGAPKSHFALLSGHSDAGELVKLDLLLSGGKLQEFARHAQGLFWLYPSARFGSWLRVTGAADVPGGAVGGRGIEDWVRALGGSAPLVTRAMAGHDGIDGFKTNGVDYEVVVGTGEPTVQSIQVEVDRFNVDPYATLGFGSGDGTVPALSATQGAIRDGKPLGEPVGIHYVCGVDHVALPGNPGVQARIRDYLLKGSAVAGPEVNCPYTGLEIKGYRLPIRATAATTAATGGALTIAAAVAQDAADVFSIGANTTVVTSGRHPVTLKLSGSGLAFETRTISASGLGPARYYRPANGTVTISGGGTVARNGKPVKRSKPDRAAPKTTARVTHHGKRVSVRLKARDASGVAVIYTRIGTAKAKAYRKPLALTAARAKRLRYFSVDRFGNRERARALPR